jgi:protein-S-isoprenylcysteine O-methyltransferase Ste14
MNQWWQASVPAGDPRARQLRQARGPDATDPRRPLQTLGAAVWVTWSLRCFGVILAVVGLVWMFWALRSLGVGQHLGSAYGRPQLVLRGSYRYVRHPFYLGGLVVLIGILMVMPSVVTAGLVGIGGLASALAIVAEERRLTARFGEAYRRYQRAVPALIPLRRAGGRRVS